MRIQCSSCEKFLRINDHLMGKRIKCPGCGTVQVAEEVLDPEVMEAPPPKKKQLSSITAKPSAKRSLPREDGVSAAAPLRKRSPGYEDDEEEPRPKKKKKKKQAAESNALLIWLLAGGGGLLAVVAIVVVILLVVNGGGKGSGPQGGGGGAFGGGGEKVRNAGPMTIKFFVPAKAGQVRRINGTMDVKVTGQLNTEAKAQFEGEVTTVAVNDEGRQTVVEVKVDRLVETRNGQMLETVAPGTILRGEMEGLLWKFTSKDPGKFVNALTLTAFVDLGDSNLQAHPDKLFGSVQKQTVGSTWPLNREEASRALARTAMGVALPKDAIQGHGKLVDVVKVGGRDYVDVEGYLSMAANNLQGPLGIKIGSLKTEVKITTRFPADYSTGPVKQTQRIDISGTEEAPKGAPRAGQMVTSTMVMNMNLEVVYLNSGNGPRKGKGK